MKQILFIALMLGGFALQAQDFILAGVSDEAMIMTDIDTTLYLDDVGTLVYDIDLDGDGWDDASLKIKEWYSSNCWDSYVEIYDIDTIYDVFFISRTDAPQYVGPCGNQSWGEWNHPSPIKFNYGDTISTASFIADLSTLSRHYGCSDPCHVWSNLTYWSDFQIHYIGFTRVSNGELYLGWIKIKMNYSYYIDIYGAAVQGFTTDVPEYASKLHTVLSVDYFDLYGRMIPKPNKGFYIERKITDKGIISKKYFIQ